MFLQELVCKDRFQRAAEVLLKYFQREFKGTGFCKIKKEKKEIG